MGRLLSGGRHGRRDGSSEVEQVAVVSAVRAAARRRHLERVHGRLAVLADREQPPVDKFLLARCYVAAVQFARYTTWTVVSEIRKLLFLTRAIGAFCAFLPLYMTQSCLFVKLFLCLFF